MVLVPAESPANSPLEVSSPGGHLARAVTSRRCHHRVASMVPTTLTRGWKLGRFRRGKKKGLKKKRRIVTPHRPFPRPPLPTRGWPSLLNPLPGEQPPRYGRIARSKYSGDPLHLPAQRPPRVPPSPLPRSLVPVRVVPFTATPCTSPPSASIRPECLSHTEPPGLVRRGFRSNRFGCRKRYFLGL